MADEYRTYSTDDAPTLKMFHESDATYRCVVGPVGSGKSSAAVMEIGYYLPHFLFQEYGVKETRWLILRNTYVQLMDTTVRTFFYWFPWATERRKEKNIYLSYDNGIKCEFMYRSCDRPEDVKNFKSLEITGYLVDESIEVADEIKMMLKNRIGRFPPKSPRKFGVEITNPPDVSHPLYSQYQWVMPPPGPMPKGEPLEEHIGFWQRAGENEKYLPPNYYSDLRKAYRDNPDWIAMYIEGKPGVVVVGKQVYNNFQRDAHVANESIVWSHGELFRGWDNSGNTPAAVVLQVPTSGRAQILREFYSERENIIDFTNRVKRECNIAFPGAEYVDYADPAGFNKFSRSEGGFTSNAALMAEFCGVKVLASEQNFRARVEAVDQLLARRDGVLIDPSCTRLIDGFMGGYCYPRVGTTSEYSEKVLKNKYSHVHDALQYVTVRVFGNKQHQSDDDAFWRKKNKEFEDHSEVADEYSWMGV